METTIVRCTTCGYQLDVDDKTTKGVCDACGNSFVMKQAIEFSLVDKYEARQIKRYRMNLNRNVQTNAFDSIDYYAKEVLKLVPNDFVATYYEAYALQKLGNPTPISTFYQNHNFDTTDEQVDEVTTHILKNSEPTDRKLIESFFSAYASSLIPEYVDTFEQQVEKENFYAPVPRDVFICYRSTDEKDALEVLETLEKDGNTCWISSRNLRPNDSDNYWDNIKQAIENCKAVVVISSRDAMLSQDIQREMRLAQEIKRAVLEYKIDDAEHTTFFKHYFDGKKWVNAYSVSATPLIEVRDRVFKYLNRKKATSAKRPQSQTRPEPKKPIKRTPHEAPLPKTKVNPFVTKTVHTSKRKTSNTYSNNQDKSSSSYRGPYELTSSEVKTNYQGKTYNHVNYYDARIALALSILPWGFYSLDKFYTKEYKKALIYLFTLQLFFVGWFIDIHKYLTKVIEVQMEKNVDDFSPEHAKTISTFIIILLVLFLIGMFR